MKYMFFYFGKVIYSIFCMLLKIELFNDYHYLWHELLNNKLLKYEYRLAKFTFRLHQNRL